MTFKHKLSKRLAMMRDATVVVAAAALVAACAPGDQAISGPTRPSYNSSADGAGTTLFQEAFEDSAFAARGWYDNTGPVTTTAQHLPGSTRALEMRFPAGSTTPVAGGAMRHLFPATPTLYVSYWVKYSSNWVGSGRPYHPHEFLVLSDQDGAWDGLSNNWLTLYIEHTYQNGGIPRLALQDNKAINTSFGAPPINLVGVTENRSTAGCNGVVEFNVVTTCFNMPPWYNGKELSASQVAFQATSGPGYKADWNHVEVYFQSNSVAGGVGVPDGVMQYWFNGTLVIDRHDVLFRTGARPTIQFHQFVIAPYIGDGSPVDQYMWVDDLTVATGKIASVPPSVASVTVSPSAASVAAGAASQFSATLKDSSGTVVTGPPVTWASSDTTVATVSGSGLASAVAPGSAAISATSGGVTGTATLTVTAPAPTSPGAVTDLAATGVTDSSVTLSFTEVNDGTGQPASYVVRSAVGTTINWGSASDVTRGSCATPVGGSAVGAKRSCAVVGLLPATGYRFKLVAFRGTLNVDALFGALSNGASGTTAATPAAPVASVAVSPASAGLTVGATQQLAATLKDSSGAGLSGRIVTWASSSPAVATVSGNGLVTAVVAGSATITATSEAVPGMASIAVTATKPGTVTDLTVAGVTDSSVTLSFTEVHDGTGQPASYDIRWAVGTLNWASAGDVIRGSCAVPVAGGAIGARRSCTVLSLAAGTGYQFQLVAFRGTLNVNAVFGALSTVASGTTAATPSTPVASVTVSPASASLVVGATQQLTATLKDAGGTILTGRTITWASGSPAVATVSASGLAKALAAGSATITATSDAVSGMASIAVTAAKPGTVTNLTVAGVTDSSVTLSFTEVNDGTGQPASYDIRWTVGTLNWASASDVARGTCKVPLGGTVIGAARSCTVLGLQAGTSYQFRLVAFRGTLNVDAVFGALSNVASGTTTSSSAPVATVTVSPASASVVVGAVQQFTATLKDASGNVLTGRPVTWASSDLVVATVSGTGLASGLVVGTATLTATSEGQSGSAALTVTVAPPGGVVFQSDWSTGIGTAFNLVTDGGRWMNYWEFNGGTSVQLLSVVAGGPGGRNALKVLQRGSTYAANVQQDNVVPPSTDYYVRFYMRNDDNSSAGDHIVTVDTYEYANLTFMRKYGGGSGWQFVASLYGCGYTYPIGHWGPSLTLSNGAWYRFEYFVHFVDATHVQVHARVYDASGTQILGDADIRQSDFGGASWNGRSDWTWASYYAAGYSFCVNPGPMTSFGLGNNGQQGAADTGLPWYFAAVQIRTDRWPGP